MPVAGAALDKGAAVIEIAFRTVEPAALAIARRTIALKITDVRAGGAAAKLVPDDPRLDHDPPMSRPGRSLPCLPLQPIGSGLATPDARALSLPGSTAAAPAGEPGRGERAAVRLHRRLHDLVDE